MWHLSDGRAGHDRQVRALLDALSAHVPLTVEELAAPGAGAALRAAVSGRLAPEHSDPDWIMGAGHRSHAGLLAARRARGGRAVVLMRPSVPLAWFDACVIPRHDHPPARDNVLETLGPLSPVRPAPERGEHGLLLAGGPSRHFQWSDDAVWAQVARLVAAAPERRWRLSPSRRTPERFVAAMPVELTGQVKVVSLAEQSPAWLDRELPRAACCWVTPDSLSMIFDTLAAGVPCGVFHLRERRGSRVAGALGALVRERRVQRFDSARPDPVPPAREPLREADRVARALLERWA